MSKTRVLITDDHALVRTGLRALLGSQPDLEIVGEAADGVTVVEACRRLAPEVVLLDLAMPGRGGVAAIQDLRHTCPDVKVVVVTMHEDATYVRQAMLAGAAGYVLKKSLAAELLTAIQTVRQGQTYVAPSLAGAVCPVAKAGPPDGGPSLLESLSPREREVVNLIALGHTNTEIGLRLHISPKTVESHRKNISAKPGLGSRADIVRFALDYGLMEV